MRAYKTKRMTVLGMYKTVAVKYVDSNNCSMNDCIFLFIWAGTQQGILTDDNCMNDGIDQYRQWLLPSFLLDAFL